MWLNSRIERPGRVRHLGRAAAWFGVAGGRPALRKDRHRRVFDNRTLRGVSQSDITPALCGPGHIAHVRARTAVGADCDRAQVAVHAVLHADPQRIQQVIWNLLWNAVKFTPSGGRVTVRVRNVGGLVEVTVTDNGIGIDAEFLPHLLGETSHLGAFA